uniref:Uncharacterized protein n=1 Tax=Sphaerodactylus townsendi TaxID=933632 RepID=A0ACB8G4G8_9SAUR
MYLGCFDLGQNSKETESGLLPSYLYFQSPSMKSQQSRELANSEPTELLGQMTASLSTMQTTDQTLHLKNITVSSSSSSIEKQGEVASEFVNPFHVTEDLNKKQEVAFLLKELDILKANNKKLQEKLSEKDKELKTIKLDLELHGRAAEAKIAERAAGEIEGEPDSARESPLMSV